MLSPRILGRRFSKSISLYEDLGSLIAEYDRREDLKRMEPEERAAVEARDKAGLTQEEIEDLKYEYVSCSALILHCTMRSKSPLVYNT